MTTHHRRPIHHSALAILFPLAAHWHHRRYHHQSHHLVVDSLLNVVMLGVLLWFSIFLIVVVQPSNLGIHVQVPTLRMNESASVKLLITNEGSRKISDLQLTAVTPSTLQLTSAQQIQRVAVVDAGIQKEFSYDVLPIRSGMVKFVITGSRNGIPVTVRTVVHLQVGDVPLAITAARTSASLGVVTPVRFDIQSTSDTTLNHLSFLIQGNPDAGISESETWTVDHLAPHSSVSHTIQLQPRRSGTLVVAVRPGVRIGTTTYYSTSTSLSFKIAAATNGETLQDLGAQQTANIATEAMYYSSVGFQFGYGEIPLTAHQATTVRIFWYIRPSKASATSATVTALLPTTVSWKGNSAVSSGSAITYDAGQRRVRWAIGSWNAAQDMLTGSFDVAITPTTNMIGTYPTLLHPTTLSYRGAHDRLVTVRSAIATTRSIDPNNSLAGKVRK